MVTTASPIHTSANTPEKTTVFWSPEVGIDNSRLRSRQNIRGPLREYLADAFITSDQTAQDRGTHQRSQSRNPSLIPP